MSKLYQEAEKFVKEQFYNGTFDNRSHLNLEEVMHAKLHSDNKNKDVDYYGQREGVVHSSSIYGCLRGTIHGMLGTVPDKEHDGRQLGIFKAGNLFEDFIIEALGDKVVERQREYTYKYKSITLVGRSDFTINDEGVMRVGECKSVHSDSFWHRQREGTIIAWHNQIQLQIYMWLERELNGNAWDGIFAYISKDDCTVVSAPVKYNPRIIEEIVKPALDIINEGWEKKDANVAPLPDLAIFSDSKSQWQKNWLCTYCDYHSKCAGAGWVIEATNLVTQRNKEAKASGRAAKKSVISVEE